MKIVMTYTTRDNIQRVVCFQAIPCPLALLTTSFSECVSEKLKSFAEEVSAFRIKDCGARKLSKEMERIFQQRLDAFIHLDETREIQKERDAPDPFFAFADKRFDIRDFPPLRAKVMFDELDVWFAKECRL